MTWQEKGWTGYCALGIEWNEGYSDTQMTIAPTIWRWDYYSVDVSSQKFWETLSPDPGGAGSWSNLSFTNGSGWRKVDTFGTRVYNKTHSTQTITYTIGTNTWFATITNSGYQRIGEVSHAFTMTIPAKTSYVVGFDANGGSGAPDSLTKWYDETLALGSSTPSREGHTFTGWNTASDGTGTNYAVGDNYTANAAATLYAKWAINTFTVTFNANGGSGAPSSQTKTYGQALTLSSTKPTRTNYKFLGWATTASATTPQYCTGANNDQNTSYTANAPVTLYAVWELAYIAPKVSNLKCYRCDADGNSADEGTRCHVSFTYAVDTVLDATTNYATVTARVDNGAEETLVSASDQKTGTNTYAGVLAATGIDVNSTHTVYITLSDVTGGSAQAVTASVILSQAFFTLDILAEGHGVAIGKPATTVGLLDVGMDANFDGAVTLAGGVSGDVSASGDISTSAGLLKSTNSGNTVTIGSTNSSYCHFTNSVNRPFYFNKSVHINGDLYKYQGNRVQYVPTVLYDNASGTSGTVTLSQSAANFDHMRIYFKKDGDSNAFSSVDVDSPNGKAVALVGASYASSAGIFQFIAKVVSVSGTSITTVSDGYVNIDSSSSTAGVKGAIGNANMAVTRVEAWNEA